MDSRSPRGELVWSRKIALPPRVLMPDSKLSRVRRLAFSNMSTICLASRAWRYSRGLRLTSCPSLRMARTSELVRSLMEQRSSPARRAAAERMSGSCWTGMAAVCRVSRVSGKALLATKLSSCFRDAARNGAAGMFGENLIQSRDGLVYVLLLKNEGRQETQHGVAGAVDYDFAVEHLAHGELCELG